MICQIWVTAIFLCSLLKDLTHNLSIAVNRVLVSYCLLIIKIYKFVLNARIDQTACCQCSQMGKLILNFLKIGKICISVGKKLLKISPTEIGKFGKI